MEKTKPTQPAAHHHKQPNEPVVQPAAPMPAQMPYSMPAAKPTAKSAASKISKETCLAHMHRYVEVQGADGFCYDGIVEHVDDEWLCLAVPGAVDHMRAFFPGGGFGPFFPYRPRRFNRLVLPLAGLAAISLLPYYW
ncbi:hypothetical protein [Cohnella soli]|uniref:Uncharacterized protein n=1 Tax=Cohnella soli TaxID=425005 RepID=A0ABW0HXP7_9BACL